MKSQYSEIILENNETVGIGSDYPAAYEVYCNYNHDVKVNDRIKFMFIDIAPLHQPTPHHGSLADQGQCFAGPPPRSLKMTNVALGKITSVKCPIIRLHYTQYSKQQ